MSRYGMSVILREIGAESAPEIYRAMRFDTELMRGGIRQAFYFMGKDIVATTRQGITDGPKSGRVYATNIGARGTTLKRLKQHVASAPGEYPANWTGALRASVGFRVNNIELVVGAGTKYAWYLEGGTRNMGARPYLLPSIDKNQRESEQHIVRELGRVLGGV